MEINNNNRVLTVDIHVVALIIHCIRIELEFGKVLVFAERGKPEYPEKELSEQSREPTNSAHL